MGSLWLQNLVGCSLTEDELADIHYPKTELLLHVGHRAIQATSFISAFVVAPLVTLVKGPRNLGCLAGRSVSYAAYGAIPGTFLGPLLMYCRMRNSPMEGYYDRCYRLRKNKNQVCVDRLSYAGILTGGAVGLATSRNPLELAAIGMLTGTIMAAVYNSSAINLFTKSES